MTRISISCHVLWQPDIHVTNIHLLPQTIMSRISNSCHVLWRPNIHVTSIWYSLSVQLLQCSMTMTAIHVTSRLQYYSMSSSSHVLWRPDIYVTSIILITLQPGSCNILLQQQPRSQSRTYTIILCAPPAVFCDNSHPVTNLSSSSLWTACNVLWHGPTARHPCHDYSITHHPAPALCCNDWPAIHVTSTVLHIIQLLHCAVTTDPLSMSRLQYYTSSNSCIVL